MILFIFNLYNEKILSTWSIMYRKYDYDVFDLNNCIKRGCTKYCIEKSKTKHEYNNTISW